MSNEQQPKPMTAEQMAGIADQVNEDWEADVPHHQQWYREMLRSLLAEVQRLTKERDAARFDHRHMTKHWEREGAETDHLQAENDQQRREIEVMRSFLQQTIRKLCFGEYCGGELQEAAVEAGLLVAEEFDPARHADAADVEYFEPGDKIYVFSSLLKGDRTDG